MALWDYSDELFTVRFLDLNESRKSNLAKRIKECAHQYRLRQANGPNQDIIYDLLSEINPIIFSEHRDCRAEHYGRTNPITFNKGYPTTYTLDGHNFRKLCQLIYRILCVKKPLKIEDLTQLVYTTTGSWRASTIFMDIHWRENEQPVTETRNNNHREVGLEELSLINRNLDASVSNIPLSLREITFAVNTLRDNSTSDEDLEYDEGYDEDNTN